MRYIINYGKDNQDHTAILSTWVAWIADLEMDAIEQFKDRHPGYVVYSIIEAEKFHGDIGMGKYTEEEQEEIMNSFRENSRRYSAELGEIENRLLEYSSEELAAWRKYEKDRAAESTQNMEGLHVGDILWTSWGYDQTNISFYQIVQLKGKHTMVLYQNKHMQEFAHDYNGYTRPVRDHFERYHGDEFYTVRSKFIEFHPGKKELYMKINDEYVMGVAEFGKLYDCDCGA